MPQQALPLTWRFAIYNGTAIPISNAPSGLPTINGVRFRYDSTGSALFDVNTTFFSTAQASIGSTSFVAGSTQSNLSGWLGGDFLLSAFASGNASGSLIVFFEASPDAGTTWPSPASAFGPGGGMIVATLAYASVVSVASTASTTRTKFFSL